MKARSVIWWLVLSVLTLLGIVAFSYQLYFAGFQSQLLNQLGEDISSNQNKWENATLNGGGAFYWWIDVDLGHGFTVLTSRITQLALLGIAVQLAVTLFLMKRKESKKSQQTDPANRHPSGTSGMSPADSASRAGDMPEASGDS